MPARSIAPTIRWPSVHGYRRRSIIWRSRRRRPRCRDSISLSAPGSRLYNVPPVVSAGRTAIVFAYLSLSGTSMAAPVVTGTVALMLQANPFLTPNAVKAILQYTAQNSPVYNTLTEGSGLLTRRGAVQLARTSPTSQAPIRLLRTGDVASFGEPDSFRGGRIMPAVNAWWQDVTWGVARRRTAGQSSGGLTLMARRLRGG